MKSFKQYLDEVKKPTGDLKSACWTGYTAVGMKMKNGRKVPNCVPEEVELDEMDKSQTPPGRAADYPLGVKGTTVKPTTKKKVLKDLTKLLNKSFDKVKEEVELDEATKIITDGGVMNVHHNGHHIGNIMKSPSNKKTPYKAYSKHWDMKKLYKSKKDATDWLVQTHNTAMKEEVEMEAYHDPWKDKYFGPGEVVKQKYRVKTDDKTYNVRADTEKHAHELITKHAPDSTIISIQHKGSARWSEQVEAVEFYEEYNPEELFDILEEVINDIAEVNRIDPEQIWEDFEDVSDEELFETAAWRRKEGKSPTGGLNAKGIASYRRENPGSKLKKAVTGKVKPGSKAAKRRKSFCARMSGMKGPMKKPNGEPSRKALALRKWKCR